MCASLDTLMLMFMSTQYLFSVLSLYLVYLLVYICVCVCVSVSVCVRVYVYMYVCMNVYMYVCIICSCGNVYICVWENLGMHTYAYFFLLSSICQHHCKVCSYPVLFFHNAFLVQTKEQAAFILFLHFTPSCVSSTCADTSSKPASIIFSHPHL